MKKEFYEDYTMPEAKLTYQDGLEITIGCCYDNDDDPDYMPDYDVMFNKHISYTEFKLLADYLKDTIKPEDINLTLMSLNSSTGWKTTKSSGRLETNSFTTN